VHLINESNFCTDDPLHAQSLRALHSKPQSVTSITLEATLTRKKKLEVAEALQGRPNAPQQQVHNPNSNPTKSIASRRGERPC
jgi:hypothetical protein